MMLRMHDARMLTESSSGANQEYGYALAKGKVIKEFWDLVNWLRGINIKKEIEK